MEKVYYNELGYVCYRYPTYYQPNSPADFIFVPEEDYLRTMECPLGKTWAIIDGELQIVDDKSIARKIPEALSGVISN